jgi:diguanylate cyclase (GGDEF)-like protein/PAS domain S-box-containing protein
MTWQDNPYTPALLISALVAGVVAAVAWRRRSASGATSLTILMIGASLWAAGEAARWGMTTLAGQVAALRVVYIGAAIVPTAYFTFVLQATHREHWLTRRTLGLLVIVPLFELVMMWTDEWHHLFHTSLNLVQQDELWVLTWERGPVYWLTVIVYAYSLIGVSTLLLIAAFAGAHGPYRVQLGLILLAAVAPFIGSALTQSGVSPFRYLDLAPFAFTLAGLIVAFALFRYRLLDLVPVARDVLIESMSDGVLVLDTQGRIVDINPAAQRMIGPAATHPIGQPADTVLAAWPALVARYREVLQTRAEVEVDPDGLRFMDLQITPLRDRAGRLTGRLIVFRDITDYKRARAELLVANALMTVRLKQIQELQAQLREQAIRDPLTGLFNRRYLEETLQREFSRASREGYPIGVAMIDIDYFKQLNDANGHEAGDRVLQALAALLQAHTRAGDIVCRYGGEEFLLVLPGADPQQVQDRAEAWRHSFEATTIQLGEGLLRSTLSIGVATFPLNGETFDDVVRAADQALYRAKGDGRNCVRTRADGKQTTVSE